MAQQQYQGPDGTIYEEVPGGGYRVVSGPAAPQVPGIVVKQADPRQPFVAPLAQAELAGKQVSTATDQAQLPYASRKAAAETAKAEADATKAQREAAAGGLDPRQTQLQKDLSLDEVLTAIDTARGQASGWSTGFVGKRLQGLGGTQADDLHGTLSTIGSSVTRDVLSQLKSQSSTGASGFGALSEREGALLRDSVAALDQSQSAEQLKRNLDNVELHYRRIKAIQAGMDPSDPKVQETFGIGKKKEFDLNAALKSMGGGNSPPGGGGGSGPTQTQQYYGGDGGGGGLSLNSDGFTTVPDPTRRGAIATLDKMLRGGASDTRIMEFATNLDASPASVAAALKFRHDNPTYKGGYNLDALGFKKVPVGLVQQGMNAAAQSPLGAAGIGAANAVTGNNLDSIIGTTGGNADLARAGMAGIANANPVSSTIGNIAGGALAAGGLETALGGTAARLGVTRLGPTGIARGADALYGGISGAGNADTGNRLAGGGFGVVGGTLGGMFGRGVTRGAGALARGVTDPAVTFLQQRGVPVTAGQALGGGAKALEDKLTSFPVLGDFINARRREGIGGFNNAAFNEALAPIGQTATGQVAEQGVDTARQLVGDSFDNALGGVRVNADPAFEAQMRPIFAAARGLPDPMAGRAEYTLNTRVGNSFGPNGELTGNGFQQSVRGLQRDARAVQNEPYGYDFGTVAHDTQGALEGILQRQVPDVLPAYRNANEAFRNTSVLREAVNSARNGNRSGDTGLFMPSQLADSAAANSRRFGGTHGTTNQPFFDLSRAGQQVLPSRVPDSGTAGRVAVLGGLSALGAAGGGATGGDTAAAGGGAAGTAGTVLGAGALGSLLYTRRGQQLLVSALLDRPDALRTLGGQLTRAAPAAGMFGAGAAPLLLPGQ